MNAKIFFFLIVCTLFNPNDLFGQINAGGFPLEENRSTLKKSTKVPVITMPKADFKADSSRGPLCGRIFAHKFKVDINLKEEGLLSHSGNYNIWRLAIKSEKAYSLNLILKDFNVPAGARLFLYSPNQEQIKGAYTNANNTPYNFAISPIDGDEIVVEYEEPIDADFKAEIVIKRVNHDFKGLKTLPQYGFSETCHIEAANDTIHLARRSACQLIIDGAVFCSGNLINNTNNDANPYVITSNHCYWYENYGTEQYVLDTNMVHTTVVFFNYEAPSEAWAIEGTKEMSLSGARTIATRKTKDMMLIQLNEIPPVDYRPYYAGWNREANISGPVFSFHHPQGDVKKVSTDAATPVERSYISSELFAKNSHWRIYRWDSGMTEPGSSGGALFDKDGHIIGCLTGGDTYSSCSKPGEDYYWQLRKVWNDSTFKKNLGLWLDPNNTGVSSCDGLDPYKEPCRRITHRAYNETPAVPDTKNYAAGTNTEGMTEFAEEFEVNKDITLYGVYFFPIVGTYNTLKPIYLRIYKGTNGPKELIYEQKVRIQNNQYNSYEDKIETSDTRRWGGVENYVRLTTPLKLDSTFFVSFSVPTGNTYPFALYYSDPKKDKEQNTAYFLNATKQWKPFTEHPTLKAATSLMVDVVLRDGWDNEDPLNPVTPETPIDQPDTLNYPEIILFYPSVTTGELNIEIPKGDVLESLQVVDMNGRTLYLQDNLSVYSHYRFNIENVCIQKNVYNVIAKFKYAKKKTFRFLRWGTDSTK